VLLCNPEALTRVPSTGAVDWMCMCLCTRASPDICSSRSQVGKRNRHVVTIDSFEDVPPNDEVALMKVRCCRFAAEAMP
jgi:hypothetical protein